MIYRRKLDRHELAHTLINHVKIMVIESAEHFLFESGELMQDPAIELGERLVGNRIP